MSATVEMSDAAPAPAPASPALGAAATAFVAATALLAAGIAVPLALSVQYEPHNLLVFGVLAAGAALGSVLIVSTERNHGFNTALAFIAAAAMFLPPPLVALIGLAQYWPDLVRRRYPWYSQVFNLANYTLNALAAWATLHLVERLLASVPQLGQALGAAAACVVLVTTNHVLLAGALKLARGQSLADSGLFSWKSLSTDLLLASLGVTVVGVWSWNPYLTPLTIAPFLLISRSFTLLELLQRSERRFRAIYESTAMGIRLTDTNGRVIAHNAAFAEMHGRPGDDLVGLSIEEFAADVKLDELAGAGGRESHEVEQRYRRADGTEMWGHLTASLVRDTDGNAEFTIGMMHDVSDRKQLEQRLYQAQKMDAIGRLAGGVAHDFNNLLTIISAHSAFLLESLPRQNAGHRSDLEAIAGAAERAASLTRQLLAFGRKQVLQPRDVDLNSVVVDTSKLLRRLIGEHIEVVTSFGRDLGTVRADPGQLEQVLVNLALNGRDAMPDGGTLTIRTENCRRTAPDESVEQAFVVLSVTDTGVGMDDATQAKMFEPFFTTKENEGTGLGLASVYGIVAQSGGFVDVVSAAGRGTTLAVHLPLVAPGEREQPVAAGEPGRPAAGNGATILLVEDNDAVRDVARRSLASRGYVVLEAFDGADAIDVAAATTGPIDLLVTDVVMPRATGPQLAAQLAVVRPGLKVLYMSGYTDQTVVPLSLAGPGTGFIQKPFTREGLTGAVRDLLEEEDLRREDAVGAHPHR